MAKRRDAEKIASHAREDIERFMGTKVYMETWVKVKENWRDNVNLIKNFWLPGRLRQNITAHK